MSEKIHDKTIFSLSDVTRSIQRSLAERYSSSFWVKAEMNKLNFYSHSGHCYPELVEKIDGKVAAQVKSVLWKDDYLRINSNFLSVLKEPLKDGIKILFLAKITFDSVYGLSLHIIDIDPAFTLGDLEKEKKESIDRLKREGIHDRNKQLLLARLPKRLAIISVETSKGYADFLRVIDGNTWGYRFFHMLFPALLQGEKAVGSIIRQLERIKEVRHHFDAVAIIRGGGGDVGLSCYNHFDLAKAIALFPIPVLTGIGHATNETVCEMISFENAITPTRLGEFLVQKFHDFSVPVQRAQERLAERSKRLLADEKQKLQAEVKLFRSVTDNIVSAHKNELKAAHTSIRQQTLFLFRSHKDYLSSIREKIVQAASNYKFRNETLLTQYRNSLVARSASHLKNLRESLMHMEKDIINMDPVNVLRRGYSITYHNGGTIKNIESVNFGDIIETKIYDGLMKSTVNTIENGREQ